MQFRSDDENGQSSTPLPDRGCPQPQRVRSALRLVAFGARP